MLQSFQRKWFFLYKKINQFLIQLCYFSTDRRWNCNKKYVRQDNGGHKTSSYYIVSRKTMVHLLTK